MSRLETLQNSLAKKNAAVDSKISNHFATVSQANGQPLNDKRNGAATFKKWDKQNDSIRTALAEVEKTERAIEREEYKIAIVEAMNERLPKILLDAVESGELIQWRKYPNRFFVAGVESARLIWDFKKQKLMASHTTELSVDCRAKFLSTAKRMANELTPAV